MKQNLSFIFWAWLFFNATLTLLVVWKSRVSNQSHEQNKANLKIALVNGVREFLAKSSGLSLLGFLLWTCSSCQIKPENWSLLRFLSCFLIADFCYYVGHYAHHKVQILWNQHAVHHSSKSFHLSTAYRKSWFYFLTKWIFFFPMAFLPFPPEMILISIGLIVCYTHLLHIQALHHLPFLERLINTPAAHRIHHSSHPTHLDKNMGGFFMFWDQAFGTFSLEQRDQVIYGLTTPLETSEVFKIMFSEWRGFHKVYLKQGIGLSLLKYLVSSPTQNKSINMLSTDS